MTDKTANSSSKSAEQATAQMLSKTDVEAKAKAGPVVLDHGDKAEKDKAPMDPWGTTPLQMRDVHSPEVDPASNEPSRGGADLGQATLKVDPMEPGNEGRENAPEGGTNAPA